MLSSRILEKIDGVQVDASDFEFAMLGFSAKLAG